MNNQDSEKYETLYRELLKYSEETHERNKKRISAGIKCLIIIPVLLLILLFNVTSNKIAFLIIWIMSVLIITGVLIAIEYKDIQQCGSDRHHDRSDLPAMYLLLDESVIFLESVYGSERTEYRCIFHGSGLLCRRCLY